MVRRTVAMMCALVASLGVAGCRESTVDLGFRPEPGAAYSYRYEIHAVVTRSLAGEDDEVSELDTVLLVDQEVLERTADGARVQVEIRRDGQAAVSAVALLDRAGSLQGIDAIDGFAVDPLLTGAPVSAPAGLPAGRLRPGERWTIDGRTTSVTGRLQRLGVIQGEDVAVVQGTSTDEIDEDVAIGGSATTLRGGIRAASTTTYDLDDGAIRESSTSSRGTLDVLIAPPEGVTAEPVDGTISYEIEVQVIRVD